MYTCRWGICVCMYMCVCACVCIYMYVCLCVHVCVCMYICICIYGYACMNYVYVSICVTAPNTAVLRKLFYSHMLNLNLEYINIIQKHQSYDQPFIEIQVCHCQCVHVCVYMSVISCLYKYMHVNIYSKCKYIYVRAYIERNVGYAHDCVHVYSGMCIWNHCCKLSCLAWADTSNIE